MEQSIEEIENKIQGVSKILMELDLKEIILFGSFVKNTFHKNSDIDIAYSLNNKQTYKCQHNDIRQVLKNTFIRRVEAQQEIIIFNNLKYPFIHRKPNYCNLLNTPKKTIWKCAY